MSPRRVSTTNTAAAQRAQAAREAAEKARRAAEAQAALAKAKTNAAKPTLTDAFVRSSKFSPSTPKVDTFSAATLSGLRDTRFDAIDSKLATTQSTFNDAKATVEANNKKLSQQLSRLGPGLRPEQKQAFMAQFRQDHAADFQRYEQATTDLKQALKEASQLAELPPQTTLRALEAAGSLAKTPEGAEAAKDFAVAIAKKLETNPNLFVGKTNLSPGMVEKALNQVLSDAVPNLFSNELRLAKGNATAAGNALAQKLEGVDRLRVFASSIQPLKKGVEGLKTGNLELLKTLDKNNLFGRSFQVAGVALAVAKLASGADLSASDYLQTLASTGKDGTELLAMGMKALSSTSKLAANASDALETGWAQRIAPGLGVAANAIQTGIDFMKARGEDGNAGDVMAVVGDSLATVGSVLSCFGALEWAALPLQIVGTAIGKLGNQWSDSINFEKDVAELKNTLQCIGLDEAQAEQLARADGGALRVLEAKYGPDELRALLVRNPNAFTSEYAAREYLAISQRTNGYPWSGQRR